MLYPLSYSRAGFQCIKSDRGHRVRDRGAPLGMDDGTANVSCV
jgi:hypothetical protein